VNETQNCTLQPIRWTKNEGVAIVQDWLLQPQHKNLESFFKKSERFSNSLLKLEAILHPFLRALFERV
jgi:hypothetical protein